MTLRWGILSTADIGMSKVTPAIQAADRCEVVAISSRSIDSAREAAGRLGIGTAHGSYEELLADEGVDAVYIPLPNDLHAEWTKKAAAAGKHVLCEKPLAMSAAQAQEMVDACDEAGVVLAEAFMYRHHPLWVEAKRLVDDGAIGDLVSIVGWFSYFNDDPANIRNKPENGGGAVMDIGCYPINASRFIYGAEPTRVEASVHRDPGMGIDIVSSAILEFEGGRQASFSCSTRAEPDQGIKLLGTAGRIDIPIPFNIPPDLSTRILLTIGGDPPVSPDTREIVFGAANQYTLQAELFATAVLDGVGAAVHPSDGVANMEVIEAILAN